MILDDFVMLGKTVPEVNSDGRQFVCTAGYSLELRQPIRIYPMARRHCPARWSVSRIPLERNPKDNREASWKIRGDRSVGNHESINNVIHHVRNDVGPALQRHIVKELMVESLDEANTKRLSLCVLFPGDIPKIDLEQGDNVEMAPTPDMFGYIASHKVSARFKWHPRLRFVDSIGKPHDLMLRDWGCYEWMRKEGDDAAVKLGDNLGLIAAPPLFCGNLNRFPNSWLVISVFSGALHARPEVFDQQFSLFGDDEAA